MTSSIRFSVLASGSSGNTCYIETDQAGVLVDAGLSCRETERRLEKIGVDPSCLDALIITHEHSDHIKGAGPVARRFDLPVYMTQKTLDMGLHTLGRLERPIVVETGETLSIHDLNVETFTKCHDAEDPLGLVFSSNGTRIGFVTDLGASTRLVEDRLKGCDALIMEFNYDQVMLEKGPYPLDLKRRIKGRHGHLSNLQAGELLRVLSHDKLKCVVLAHLSETNNHPDKALQEARKALAASGMDRTDVVISTQGEPVAMIEL